MHPAGGDGFDIADDVRDTMRGAEAEEQMDVVSDSADGLRDTIEVSYDAAEITVQAFTPRGQNRGGAILGAEHEMVVEGDVGGWHDNSLSDAPAGAAVLLSISGG